ncbi:MAG: GNAT family N-acetyltransferase [Blastocatellia bacterium]|nr:GNAT family N-acetyltransferase [Blastocatellia bacterium]
MTIEIVSRRGEKRRKVRVARRSFFREGRRLMNSVEYSIRPAGEEDQLFLWEMLYHAIYVPDGQAPIPREIVNQPEIAKYVDRWGRGEDHGVVAIENLTLEPVGAAWLRIFPVEKKGYGHVREGIPELSIAILPGYRNQGIGSALLRRLIGDARGRFSAISLSVSRENPAVRLYERFGFEAVDQSGSSITMLKEL